MALVVVEGVLRTCGIAPPVDPAVLRTSSAVRGFDPFVVDGDGIVSIRPEWVARSDSLVVHEGERPGEFRLVPAFRELRFEARKPASTIRVAVLGGSSTFGLYVAREAAYPAVLEQRLRTHFEGRTVEVLNLGCAGFASDRCQALLDTVLEYSPDVIVVDCGNNEMLAYGVEAPEPSASTLAWRSRLAQSYVYGWLRAAWSDRSAERRIDGDRLAELVIFDPARIDESTRVPPSKDIVAAIERAFGERMRAIAAAAATRRVPCVFVLPAPNLLAPPFAPAAVPGQTLTAESVVARAIGALREADVKSAIAAADALLAQAPGHPVGHFLRGLAFSDVGDTAGARRELQLAVDHDARPHRITSGLARALEEAARASGVELVDEREILLQRVDRASASEWFVDHCHPTAAGHRQIAAAIDRAIQRSIAAR